MPTRTKSACEYRYKDYLKKKYHPEGNTKRAKVNPIKEEAKEESITESTQNSNPAPSVKEELEPKSPPFEIEELTSDSDQPESTPLKVKEEFPPQNVKESCVASEGTFSNNFLFNFEEDDEELRKILAELDPIILDDEFQVSK